MKNSFFNTIILLGMLYLIIIQSFYRIRIILIPFKKSKYIVDCYDVCYSNKAYCIEFYDRVNGLEYSCGKGEGKYFEDRMGGSQYAVPGDMCLCLYDPGSPNMDPFIECNPQNPCLAGKIK